MPFPLLADVKEILEPFHPRIRSIVERAWLEYRMIAALRAENGIAPLLYSRTVSNDVFDAIARYAIAEFAGDPSVHIEFEAQTIKLFFKGHVCARFKKGDDNGLGQNIPTQAALAFEAIDGQLPGFPPETAKVEFIWLANDLLTRLEHVLVVARDGDELLWDYEIEANESTSGGTIIHFPKTSTSPALIDDDLVKPKTPAAKTPDRKE